MPTFTTEYIKNLTTGEPFKFEVSAETLERYIKNKKRIASGQSTIVSDLEEFLTLYECTLFPAYKELLKIFFKNGFTTELITMILTDFGTDQSQIEKLLSNECYISKIRSWFEGITCDGERAARTLMIVYTQTQQFLHVVPAN